MCYISFIIVLNVSIILMMMVAFYNITFVNQIQSLQVYQLADFNNPDYDEYVKKTMISSYEKKLNINQYFEAIHNFTFMELNLSDEIDFSKHSENIKNYCDHHYKYPKYAAQQYIVTKFRESITELAICAIKERTKVTPTVNIEGQQYIAVPKYHRKITAFFKAKECTKVTPTVNIEDSPEYIFSLIRNAIRAAENRAPVRSSTEKRLKRLQIKAIDKALEKLSGQSKSPANQYYINQFYRCFQKFKNDVFNIHFENAKHPTQSTNIYIGAGKKLTEKEKNEILQTTDIDFLNYNLIYRNGDKEVDMERSIDFLNKYTGYNGRIPFYNDAPQYCRNALIHENKEESEWEYKSTKLSYQFIFPSQSDSLDFYKQKSLNIIKTLKNLDKSARNDVTKNNIYTILEDAYNNVDETYLQMMKKCRALSEEDIYEIYVMRLINNGCRPLAKTEWNEELKDAKDSNDVAKAELRYRP